VFDNMFGSNEDLSPTAQAVPLSIVMIISVYSLVGKPKGYTLLKISPVVRLAES